MMGGRQIDITDKQIIDIVHILIEEACPCLKISHFSSYTEFWLLVCYWICGFDLFWYTVSPQVHSLKVSLQVPGYESTICIFPYMLFWLKGWGSCYSVIFFLPTNPVKKTKSKPKCFFKKTEIFNIWKSLPDLSKENFISHAWIT